MMQTDFNQMLVKNAEFLKPFAVTLTHDAEKAKDLFQETMFRAIINSDKYNVGTNIKAWLYTIMRNVFINDYRRSTRRPIVAGGLFADLLPAGKHTTTGDQAESRMSEKEIWKAIHELPEAFRTPFMMYLDGVKYQHIAQTLKEPMGTIKSRIHFARKLLKQYLNKINAQGI